MVIHENMEKKVNEETVEMENRETRILIDPAELFQEIR